MSDLKPELSAKSQYHLPKHRYYELRHFCLQYRDWQKQLKMLNSSQTPEFLERFQRSTELPNPTERIAIMRAALSENVRIIEEAAQEADKELAKWLLLGVTEGRSFENLKTTMDIPCERDMYYARYRKFFWLLSRNRT